MGKPAEKLKPGDKFTFKKKLTEEDVEKFAETSGDFNPLHIDETLAAKTIFKGKIVHGILTLGLISAALAKLPGIVVYLSQTARFKKPVRAGETVKAVAIVRKVDTAKSRVRLETFCVNEKDERVLEGEAEVLLLE
ncbi:enoyl-CoA hydratase [Candidatus Bathyarchaeota archaeon]|nr:MAG: enoyl-CoA hydratase [Candidatus Bathyarchaeota archaeon]